MVNYSFSLLTFEYFLLVLVRITSFVFSAPFFSMSNTPRRVKIGFSVFVSILLIGVLPESTIEYGGVIEYATIVVKEGITGLLIGFGANICNSIVLFAGNIMDLNMGLSMATEYDPVSKTNSPITGNFYNYLVMLLLMSSGMYQYILQAIVDSFTLIPVNGQNFMWDSLLQTMVSYMTDSMVLGFRVALPVFAVLMILNCILGIMAKIAPQMNMFSVGIQLKILLGFLVLFLTIQLLPYVSDFVFTEMKRMVTGIASGMHG